MIQKDADNNIVGCDKCGSRNIKKRWMAILGER